jgi:ligand-binding sensor domain-containing protein
LRSLFLIIFLFNVALKLGAQTIVFDHITEADGLPQSEIISITRDQRDFYWVATQAGISRYNGYTFESFGTYESEDASTSIIEIDAKGNYVYGLFSNKYIRINTLSLEIEQIRFSSKQTIINPKQISSTSTQLLLGAENGFWVLNEKDGKVLKHFKLDEVKDILQLAQGKWLIGTVSGIYVYYPYSLSLINLNLPHTSFINKLCLTNKNAFAWVEGDGILYETSLNGLNFAKVNEIDLLDSYTISSLCFYRNRFYLGTAKGLLEVDKNDKLRWYVRNGLYNTSISNNAVSCLYSDCQDRLWVGTFLGGLNYYNPYKHKFRVVSMSMMPNLKEVREVLSFGEAANGDILYSTFSGDLGWFDPNDASIYETYSIEMPFYCLLPIEGATRKFLGGSSQGLFLIEQGNAKPKQLKTTSNAKSFEGDIKSIKHWKEDLYWMAGSGGLFLYDLANQKTLEHFNIGNSELGSDNIRSINVYRHSEILVSTASGLYTFAIGTKKFKLLNLNTTSKLQPFVGQTVVDKFGRIWAGTRTGLFIREPNGRVRHFSSANGLPDNSVYSLVLTKDGKSCWMSTNNGLVVISTQDFSWVHYDINDGLQGSEFNEGSSLITSAGEIYFGGLTGFNHFFPNQLTLDSLPFRVEMIHISDFNKVIEPKPYYYFTSDENFLTFEFVSLDFSRSNGNTYYYQLEGLQNDWIQAGNRRFASFGQLPPGDYVFKVKARNMDNYWSSNVATIHFTIVPVFYKSIWFIVTIALLVLILIGALLSYRVRLAFKEQEEKAALNATIGELELRALRAQMNPHFIFNSLNSIQDFVLNNESKLAAKYLSKFAKLIRMILDLSEQTFVRIDQKVVFLNLYIELEALRLSNSFTWQLEVDEKINGSDFVPTLLVQPYIENAIWHGLQHKKGADKKLHITFKYINEDLIEVEVIDNGIGRDASKIINKNRLTAHQSKGVQLTLERMKALHKLFGSKPSVEIIDLFDENKLACGTMVVMLIPVKHE